MVKKKLKGGGNPKNGPYELEEQKSCQRIAPKEAEVQNQELPGCSKNHLKSSALTPASEANFSVDRSSNLFSQLLQQKKQIAEYTSAPDFSRKRECLPMLETPSTSKKSASPPVENISINQTMSGNPKIQTNEQSSDTSAPPTMLEILSERHALLLNQGLSSEQIDQDLDKLKEQLDQPACHLEQMNQNIQELSQKVKQKSKLPQPKPQIKQQPSVQLKAKTKKPNLGFARTEGSSSHHIHPVEVEEVFNPGDPLAFPSLLAAVRCCSYCHLLLPPPASTSYILLPRCGQLCHLQSQLLLLPPLNGPVSLPGLRTTCLNWAGRWRQGGRVGPSL